MKLTQTTEHEITFTVESFWSEEGGMGQNEYGKQVNTLEEAIHLLELARVARSTNTEWIIVGRVATKIKK